MKNMTVALAGNPNVGKSTLFNALTGLHQHTGNWPGKTVGVARGSFQKKDMTVELVDLPGTYALDGASEDEQIAAQYIQSGEADYTVVVCDGSALERNLILAIQILQRTQAVILCVNLMDEARSRGIGVDPQMLSRELGIPVVLTAAGKKEGMDDLMECLLHYEDLRFCPKNWDDPVERAREIAHKAVQRNGIQDDWRVVLDRILLSRRRGIPILLLLLFIVILITVWGANYPSQLLERLFDKGYIGLRWILRWTPEWLSGILVDGMYATAARVMAVMIPPMAIFFPLFTILEDVGYLPRMAFLLDGAMEKCGGSGRQALTMCMGLGCNAVGVTGCRIVESPRERLAAILTNAMIPCNGRFPTLILLAGLILPRGLAAMTVAGMVVLGVLGAMATTGVLTKMVSSYDNHPFVMELPPFRRPRVGKILIRSLLDRTAKIALRALAVAAPAGAVLWLLGQLSLLDVFAQALDPLGWMLGMNGVILLGFVLSFPANELLIPVVLLSMLGQGQLQTVGDNAIHLLSELPTQTVLCMLIFTVFHWPCATTLLTIRKETGSIRKTAAAFFLPTAVGIILCILINHLH